MICFLILSTGENNFKKLPVLTEGVPEFNTISNKVVLKNNVSVICFLGNNLNDVKSGVFNLNEKIYKKFIDYNNFQIVAIYPKENESDVLAFKEDLGEYTDMKKWRFVAADEKEIQNFFNGLSVKTSLENLGLARAFIIDKNLNLRGRSNDKDFPDGRLEAYNLNSVSEIKSKMKDDINVLFYEYYAAFKKRNQNKADRKEVGL
ncbi:hypothetical protein [Winogradskyella sp.]|uniref:hypothetical protein n=1 Tax=Winogradskyella sp. TaxID=1883156 RepID=UPI0025EBB751|nr:hypothetical protein [Winogradskyella sp.]